MKQNQSRPQVALPVRRQLSKNVVQHPTLGHHSPCSADGATAGGRCSSCPGPSRETRRLLFLPPQFQHCPTGPQQTHFISVQGAWLPSHSHPEGPDVGFWQRVRRGQAPPPAPPCPGRRASATEEEKGQGTQEGRGLSLARRCMLCVCYLCQPKKEAINILPHDS